MLFACLNGGPLDSHVHVQGHHLIEFGMRAHIDCAAPLALRMFRTDDGLKPLMMAKRSVRRFVMVPWLCILEPPSLSA
jgi:hypothetical protein